MELAAAIAAELGLEVWFSPYPLELKNDRRGCCPCSPTVRFARSWIRLRGNEVVFVTGAELSLMNGGFLPGDNVRGARRAP